MCMNVCICVCNFMCIQECERVCMPVGLYGCVCMDVCVCFRAYMGRCVFYVYA